MRAVVAALARRMHNQPPLVRTKRCAPSWRDDVTNTVFGHGPHAYVEHGHAYRCRGSEPMDLRRIEDRILDEVREIRMLLEER